jgi:hypothetical protein
MMACLGLLLGIMRAEAAIDTDALWSARFGADYLASGRLPRTDPYSWTAYGHSWIPSSWGWNVLLGLGYRSDGVRGIWLVGILAAIALALAVSVAAARIGAAPIPTAMTFAALGILALVVSPRAQTASNVLALVLPMSLPTLLFTKRRSAVRAGVILVAMQVLWMNLHTVAVLGPLLLVAAGAGHLYAARLHDVSWTRGLRRLTWLVPVVAIGCLATPYGLGSIRHMREVRSASVGLINEWDHAGLGNGAQVAALVLIVVAVVLLRSIWRAERYDAVAILILLAIASATAVRFAPMLATYLIPEIGLALGGVEVRRSMQWRIVLAECVVLLAFASLHIGTFGKLSTANSSPRLVAMLPHDCRLVNDYVLGGAVTLLRPDVRVSVDGRNDMYGRANVLAAVGMLGAPPGVTQRIDSAGVNCVLAPSGAPLVAALEHDSGWRVAGHDAVRTLLLRAPDNLAAGR